MTLIDVPDMQDGTERQARSQYFQRMGSYLGGKWTFLVGVVALFGNSQKKN